MAERLPEDRRAKVMEILEAQDLSQMELVRDGNELLFRVGTDVFHLPIIALTQPTRGLEDLN